jgi:hypothetical protein
MPLTLLRPDGPSDAAPCSYLNDRHHRPVNGYVRHAFIHKSLFVRGCISDALQWLIRDPDHREHARKDDDLKILRDRAESLQIIESGGAKP